MILYSKNLNGKWTAPNLTSFSVKYFDGGPFFSFDGKRLYFYSLRPLIKNSDKKTECEIWFIEKNGDSWSNPHHLKVELKGDKLLFSLSKNNNLYFTSGHGLGGSGSGDVDIYFTRFSNDSYSIPERLSEPINSRKYIESDALVSPDETYLIFYSFDKPENFSQYDLYVSFKVENQWSEPINLGEDINTDYSRFPRFSPDGKNLFFVRRDGIYWVRTKIIEELKLDELK